MSNPIITTVSPGFLKVDSARFLRADFFVTWDGANATFSLVCPAAATVTLYKDGGATLTLAKDGIATNAATGPFDVGTARITVNASINTPSAGLSTLTFNFLDLGGSAKAHWITQWTALVASAGAAEDDGGTSCSLRGMIVDPAVTNNNLPPGADITDGSKITLDGTANYTQSIAAGAPPPPAPFSPQIEAKWTQLLPTTSSADPSTDPGADVTGTGPVNPKTTTFRAPSVYSKTTLNFAVVAFYKDSTLVDYFPFANTGSALSYSVIPRGRHIALVVDRSGSMTGGISGVPGSRWDYAVRAAHVWSDLYVAFRNNVDSKLPDRAGILIFENQTGSWGPPTSANDLKVLIPAGSNLGATTSLDVNPLDLGSPGSCTPIGDALVLAMKKLAPGGDIPPEDEFTVVLITDGYENCGSVYVDESGAPPASGISSFSEVLAANSTLATIRSQMRVVALGLGSTVQESVLNQLKTKLNAGAPSTVGMYNLVNDPKELAGFLAQGFKFALNAEEIPPTSQVDPNTWLYTIGPNEHRTAFVVMGLPESGASDWVIGDDVELWYGADGVDPTTQIAGSGIAPPAGVVVHKRNHHGIVEIDLAALRASVAGGHFDKSSNWKLKYSKGLPDSGGGKPLNAINMVDLYLGCDYRFDKPEYAIGDPIGVSCVVRAGGQPVTDAAVEAILLKPGEGLGTFLAVNGSGYHPMPSRIVVNPDGGNHSFDPPHPKLAMRQTLLNERHMDDLPVIRSTNMFTDGTNRLHDHDQKGVYSNTFAATDKEGTYTFVFRASGPLSGGLTWARTITLSTWVGVKVDVGSSPITLHLGQPAPAGWLAATLSLRPRAHNGEFLGPFRDGVLRVRTTAGILQPLVGQYDGTYSIELQYRSGQVPIVSIEVGGIALPTQVVSNNPLCRIIGRIPRTYEDLIREIEEHFCCHESEREKHEGWLHEFIEHMHTLEASHPLSALVDRLRHLFSKSS